MAVELHVLSGAKGSNHGGVCDVLYDGSLVSNGYVKYCSGSKCGHDTLLTHLHQPIYEAMTYSWASYLGLCVPEYYLIDNRDNSLRVNHKEGVDCEIGEGMPFYFLSLMDPEGFKGDRPEVIDAESVYRDFLCIEDIKGKRQNYSVIDGRVSYHDLGCSFVRAHDSVMEFPHGKKGRILKEKEIKKEMKKLGRFSIRINCEDKKVNLKDFLDTVDKSVIPVFGREKYSSLDSYLIDGEIAEIRDRIVSCLHHTKFVARYRDFLLS